MQRFRQASERETPNVEGLTLLPESTFATLNGKKGEPTPTFFWMTGIGGVRNCLYKKAAGKSVATIRNQTTQQLIQMSSYATETSETTSKATSVKISGKNFAIYGEDDYLHDIGDEFEPNTVTLFELLCAKDARVLDIGANIGMTALALARICPRGWITAIEPVPRNFEYLKRNVSESGARNIKLFNFALGSSEGDLLMQGHPSNFACSFVADNYTIPADDHFAERVPVKRLDNVFPELSLDRLDFVKIDVEGFELEVFAGAKDILNTYKPMVFLEMNHWCLNIYRHMSIPEFRERLIQIFPYVYAIDGLDYLDYVDQRNVHHINYHHVLEFKYMNLIAGFDREEILSKLSSLER